MSLIRPFSELSDGEISQKITDETIERVRLYLNNLATPDIINKLQDYSLVITGTIGAGKSTICESIVHILKTLYPSLSLITYPEFLFVNDGDTSNKLLTEKINNRVSVNTFQSFILDKWRNILEQNKNEKGFKIFERCVDDCVFCFCNIENKRQKLSDFQLFSLYEELKKLDEIYQVPTYFETTTVKNNDSHFTKINSTDLNYNIQTIFSIISADLHNGIKNRIIGLYADTKLSKERIRKRLRDGELGYTDEQIDDYNKHYKKLFKILDNGVRFNRFVDIGQLL